MRVLAIGNSFSEDATRYLHQIAEADGENWKVVNLYIGGCSLRGHYLNALENKKSYVIEFNGASTGFFASIKEGLISDHWDIVTLQQVSHEAPDYGTYQPYLSYLAEYVRKYAPKSELYLHQTWAYEQGSKRLCEELKYGNYREMLSEIVTAYQKAKEEIRADGIIPSGELFDKLLQSGIEKVHRDTFHASLGAGRYALGLLWYAVLSKNDVKKNGFSDFDETVSESELEIIKNAVDALLKK